MLTLLVSIFLGGCASGSKNVTGPQSTTAMKKQKFTILATVKIGHHHVRVVKVDLGEMGFDKKVQTYQVIMDRAKSLGLKLGTEQLATVLREQYSSPEGDFLVMMTRPVTDGAFEEFRLGRYWSTPEDPVATQWISHGPTRLDEEYQENPQVGGLYKHYLLFVL